MIRLFDKPKPNESPRETIFRKSIPEPNTGCWLWLGNLDPGGYAQQNRNGRTSLAHIVAYENFVAAIPAKYEVDHLCKVRCCVNPEHLEAVTVKVNCHRSDNVGGVNARKLVCNNGHPFDVYNTRYKKSNGARQCRTCLMLATRRYRSRKNARNS